MESEWDPDVLRGLMEEMIPFNKYVGVEFVSASPEGVSLRVPFRPELVGDPSRPALHGGVTSMVIDTAGGLAAFVALGPRYRVSTVDLMVDYLRPGPLADIVAHAHLVRQGNKVCLAVVDVRADEPGAEIFARGRAVYMVHHPRPESPPGPSS